MPRTARIIYDDGIYHILNRGNNRQVLFYDSNDYAVFKKFLKRYLANLNVEIYHYVIMPNHFHLIIKVIKAKDLSKFMQRLCQTYANYHRRRHETVGYLFQNRYKSLFIDNERYLLECARYIERNPLRANLIGDLNSYLYSSYHHYANGDQDNLITPNPVYFEIGKTPLKRQKAYVQLINTPRPYEEILDKKLQISR